MHLPFQHFHRRLRAAPMAMLAAFLCLSRTPIQAQRDLETNFRSPPAAARPWVYWFWMNGNITAEGITADLEAMHRVGIGGALVMSVSAHIPPGKVDFMTPEWRKLFAFALGEAERLGLRIVMNNDDGFTGSGGPWNPVENSMQMLTASEIRLKGPQEFAGQFPRPPARLDYYRDIALLAFPTPADDEIDFRQRSPKVTASDPACETARLIDNDAGTLAILPLATPEKPQWIQLEFAAPFRAQSLTLSMEFGRQAAGAEILVSEDGKTFRRIARLDDSSYGVMWPTPVPCTFASVEARYFRVNFITPAGKGISRIGVGEIELHGDARIENWPGKAAIFRHDDLRPPRTDPAVAALPREKLLDLSSKLDAEGRLHWDVPAGNWTLVRLGHTTNGKENHPCTPLGTGLECDKMSKEALETHFNGFLAKLISDVAPQVGKTLAATHVDSWELGTQNWTPKFREEFVSRRGYDPLPYYPALLGRAVQRVEVSERFLWDFRKTLADLIADNYFGHLRSLAQKHQMGLSVEAYGSGNFDDMQCASRASIPMAEFWTRPRDVGMQPRWLERAKQASSVGHTNGCKVIGAESFTAYPYEDSWQNHPFKLKNIGDEFFTLGINRFIIHRYAMQPWMDRWPGMTFGHWGTNFERTQTWFEQSRAWIAYLTRCQYLLQEGEFVGDLCYFIGQEAPNRLVRRDFLNPKPPAGYDFDGCSEETILRRMTVEDGRIVLPDGMCYRLLVLPPRQTMTPDLLRKLRDLVQEGAWILGPKPEKSPSLANYPQCDEEVRKLAEELWGDTTLPGEKTTGKGKVFWGKTPAEILRTLNVPPDVEFRGRAGGGPWIHRRIGETEIYFVSNQSDNFKSMTATFRVGGKIPELWRPDTGKIEPALLWQPTADGRTKVSLQFDPRGSAFVVFRKSAEKADPFVAISRNGEPLHDLPASAEMANRKDNACLLARQGGTYEMKTASGKKLVREVSEPSPPLALSGPWKLRFPPGWGAPELVKLDRLISWPLHENEGVKYFSGTATYSKKFEIPADRFAEDTALMLDLGNVAVIAEVILNGKELGILWKPPFRLDVTDFAKPGTNRLEIRVTNLWVNRLVGDERKPPYLTWTPEGKPAEWPDWVANGGPVPKTGRYTFTTRHYYEKDSPLLESGLLGPVILETYRIVPLRE
ncbi:MAG: hypothetical protein IT426_17915 [Pirellulales bacterium]|nr:hypothetical protein [Pirellulales bacterium]